MRSQPSHRDDLQRRLYDGMEVVQQPAPGVKSANLCAGGAPHRHLQPITAPPDNAWREYPRPALVPPSWKCLNGFWSYRVIPGTETRRPDSWDGEILVPFAIECALSGVMGRLTPQDALWYQRTTDIKLAACIYTQTSDDEGEINGTLTYDRRVKKATAETLAEIHRKAGF